MLNKQTDSLVAESFSDFYAELNNYIINQGDYVESRNGDTREILDFKTTLTNPYKRLVGVAKRDVNVFFLMAEAMWIFSGRCDVEFLKPFNSKLSDYSDDGVVYHAPYGWRMRHQGLQSFIPNDSNKHNFSYGTDQIQKNIKILSKDPDSRRVVIEIWNPELDLDKQTKDLPCNDMVFLKIRKGKLVTTIANRSNDLHWGLTTNIFQFSFLSEMISLCLGVELGRQTHNSQSLHIYLQNQNFL
jgi:thymidylate synthase